MRDHSGSLRRITAPFTLIMTLRKLKTVHPSLKSPVPKMLGSEAALCIKLHVRAAQRAMSARQAGIYKVAPRNIPGTRALSEDDVDSLLQTARGESHLLKLEALYIQELKPQINIKDEYKNRRLMIQL